VTVKFGIGTDGRQIPISERISLALQLKRDQDRAASRQSGRGGAATEDDDGTQLDENASRDSGSRQSKEEKKKASPAKDGRSGGLQSRQQDNFEMFRSKIAQARQQRSAGSGGDAGAGSRTSGTAASDPEQQDPDAEQDGGDFADYASPVASNGKGKVRVAAARAANAAESAGDEVPSALAGDIASDWVECLDPRSRRKYYYSAELKKSTWTKPANLSPEKWQSGSNTPAAASSALPSMSSGVPSRYASPIGPAAARQQAWGDSPVASKPAATSAASEGVFSTMRAASPYSAGSFTSTHSDYSAIFTSPAKGRYFLPC
jgi:hypothetical protein